MFCSILNFRGYKKYRHTTYFFSRPGMCNIECKEIDNYLAEFNTKYKTNVKPSKHITIAIMPR